MPRPITALIDPLALRHNLTVLRQRAPHAKLCAVVKANAYGHGIERVYAGLQLADSLALLDLDEARRVNQLTDAGLLRQLQKRRQPFAVGQLVGQCTRREHRG